MWMTGTYDPELNLVLRRHRQPDAGAERRRRVPATTPGPAASSRSIPTPASWRGDSRRRRTTRTTGTRPKCRCSSTATFNGAPRKLLMQASRNGYFFVLDRTTGKNLLTDAVRRGELGEGDRRGGPADSRSGEGAVARRRARSRRTKAARTNYRSPSFDPKTGLLIVSAQDCVRHLLLQAGARRVRLGGRGLQRLRAIGVLRAIDYQTGKIRWSHDLGDGASGAGVLTTESGLTFTGDTAGNALALRTSDGTTLWHAGIGRVGNSPDHLRARRPPVHAHRRRERAVRVGASAEVIATFFSGVSRDPCP